MAIHYNSRLVTDGIVDVFDFSKFTGAATETVKSSSSSNLATFYNYSVGTSAGTKTLQSNTIADGSGTSYGLITRNTNLETGSITIIIWMNMEGITLSSGSNNNWRTPIRTSGNDPVRWYLEEYGGMNFTTIHTDGITRRLTNGIFAPTTIDANGWQMITYSYDKTTGTAYAYKNNQLVTSGPMTNGTTPTSAGLGLRYSDYIASNGFRINGANTAANPSGDGTVPGELGSILFYNKHLTPVEINQNFNALRGRYGI